MRCEGSGDKPRWSEPSGNGLCVTCGTVVPLRKDGKTKAHDVPDDVAYVATRRVYLARDGGVSTSGVNARAIVTKPGRRVSSEDVDRYGLLDLDAVRVAGSKQAPRGDNKLAPKGDDK